MIRRAISRPTDSVECACDPSAQRSPVRQPSDIADSTEDYRKEIAMADDFVQQTLDAKKRKAEEAEKKASKGIKNDLK